MTINCIIVEDEPLALKRSKEYSGKIPYLNLLGAFDNGFEAMQFLKEQKVDLVFLDIKMDELTGIQLLESLERRPFVIITTAYSEYALKGYELNVSDYLLKPFGLERFIQAVEKVAERLTELPVERDFIFVKSDYRLEKILLADVLFVEGMRDYRCIHTSAKRTLSPITFQELEAELPAARLCRVHKSFMVALDKIDSVERNRIRIKDTYIPISDTYKDKFYQLIGFGADRKK